jgi:pimeloyl-ACP methyl ester carboxylesterase
MKTGTPADKPTAIKLVDIRYGGGKPVPLCYAEWEPIDVYKGTVIAVHGLTRQKRDFDYIATTLANNGYKVLAVDAPGRGGSGKMYDPNAYNLDVYADIFGLFLKQLSLQRVHWIGTSMGGLIALKMAEKGLASKLRSLTLIDITHKPNHAGCQRLTTYITENLPTFQSVDQYTEILKKNLPIGPVPEYVWRHYAQHQLKKNGNVYAFHFDPKIARMAVPGLKAGVDLTAGLMKVECPVSLVAGGKSDICTAVEIADLKAVKPDLALFIDAEAGHVPALADNAAQQFIYGFIGNS